MRRRMVVSYRRFGTTYRHHFQGPPPVLWKSGMGASNTPS